MKYTKLGHTGLEVSRICVGCMSFGDSVTGNHTWTLDEDTSRGFIKEALDAGINFFDTANVYSLGTSEEIVGRALADFANRDEVVLATKVHGPMRRGRNAIGLSRKAIMAEVDASLRRLGMDYIDLYQIHRFDPAHRSRRRWRRCTTWSRPARSATSGRRRCTRGSSARPSTPRS